MRIKLITRIAGPEGNYPPGFVIEMADKIAQALINNGYAISLEEPKIEKGGEDNGNVVHNNRGNSSTRKKG